jgi:predicted metal-dependent hydrolase
VYPNEYIHYLVHFHGDRDYFECHEILEDYWKKHDFGNKQSVWTGLIQLAVSCYHHRRSNYSGAQKTLEKAIKILIRENSLKGLGLNSTELANLLKDQLLLIKKQQPYRSMNLPITDPHLNQQCYTLCSKLGFIWYSKSNLNNNLIVDRHKLRDRNEIIQARNRALKSKKGSEGSA